MHVTAGDLLELTAELVAVRSESFDEARLSALVEARVSALGHLRVDRIGDNVIARTQLGRPHRVVLAGHLDTVPANGNAEAVLRGETLWGVGSADMKSGLAVMIAIAETVPDPPVDLTFVFYAREEVAAELSGLQEIARERPELLEGDVAVLGEPTSGHLEAGCQGQLRVEVTLAGTRAHTARPWKGRNAIHRLGGLLAAVASFEPREPVIEGCRFRESLQAVNVSGGVAGNVVPDSATVTISYRFAPDRSTVQAVEWLRSMLAPYLDCDDSFVVTDLAPAAVPAVGHPFVAGMVARGALTVGAKLGWTDVARFAELGIPAVNFGPGDATLAHTAEEHVSGGPIEATYAVLREAIELGF